MNLFPNPSKTDWVPCPICGESDMLRQEDDEGNPLIQCVNHCCASNGGSNRDAIKGNSLHDVLNEGALYEEIGQLKVQLFAAHQIATLIRPRVQDEVKDGRGHMTTFDRARMEALAKALAAFDGA